MSIKLMRAVWNSRKSLGLSGIDAAILVKLADFAQDDGSSIYPSLEHLANQTGFSKSTIQRSLKLSCTKNILVNISDVSGRKTLTNLYKINAHKVYSASSNVVDTLVTVTSDYSHSDHPKSASNVVDTIVTVTTPLVTVTSDYSHSDHQSVIEPLIEPLLSCQNGGNFDDPEAQGVGSSKIDLEPETQNDRSPDYSHPISVAIAPSVCLEKINFEEEIQNTPPGGVDPVIGQKSSEGLLDEDFDPWGNSDPDPSDDPSGGSSKPDPVPEDLLDEDPWGNDGSPESMAFDKFCRNLLSKVAEVDRIRASRGDYIHAQAPLEDPSETDTPKTCHFSASEALPLQDIEIDNKTSVTCLKTPAIDTSSSNIILRISENDTYSKAPPKPSVKILEDNFAQWYAAYPKKVDKKKAFSAFTKAMKRITHEKLMRLTNSYAHSVQGKDPQYFPNPTTWLNGERWADVSLENCGGSSSSGLAPLTNSPAVDSRLQDFVNKHPNIHPAWPFLASKVIDQGDTILILAPTTLTLDSMTVGGN